MPALQQIGANHAIVVIRDVSESGATFYVTQSVDAWYVRLQLSVGLDISMSVGVDAGRFDIQGISVRCSSRSDEQVRTLHGADTMLGFNLELKLLPPPSSLYPPRFHPTVN